ncbi:DUF3667 domain-containing protein [uncultured Acetobacteroides sp.]|uniref:DUF3667 domain-containing protein n=1 Tax=uncultured Acetobacteroides sp. TaxID=1760811 RepID=UPI0029F5195F|nr:DUF3667 domain-containing protein [uncultured Acetobacteroides sp.]
MPIRFIRYRYLKRRRKHRYLPVKPPYTHCKNCGNVLHSQYCSVCGQFAHLDNRPFGESLAFYLEHHYGLDHKLGSTLYNLFFRPGFLTKEYMAGRIVRHVHPFKLYFFSSILLFGVALHFTPLSKENMKNADELAVKETPHVDSAKTKDMDKVAPAQKKGEEDESVSANDDDDDESAFDSMIEGLAEGSLKGKTQGEVAEMFFHNLSISVLLLMPIFALLLKLFYIRRKQYYMSHLIHSIHLHSVLFILLSVGAIWDSQVNAHKITGWMLLLFLVYLVLSLSRLYGQGIRKSTVKALMMLSIYSIICLLAVVGAAIYIVV